MRGVIGGTGNEQMETCGVVVVVVVVMDGWMDGWLDGWNQTTSP